MYLLTVLSAEWAQWQHCARLRPRPILAAVPTQPSSVGAGRPARAQVPCCGSCLSARLPRGVLAGTALLLSCTPYPAEGKESLRARTLFWLLIFCF